jgi:hypothetical protein
MTFFVSEPLMLRNDQLTTIINPAGRAGIATNTPPTIGAFRQLMLLRPFNAFSLFGEIAESVPLELAVGDGAP